MPRPISAECRGPKFWDNMIVAMGRLKSAMLIDPSCEGRLKNDTCVQADAMVELALRHKARFATTPETDTNLPKRRESSKTR
jgi:hypothetical protein